MNFPIEHLLRDELLRQETRRSFLRKGGASIGAAALAALLDPASLAAQDKKASGAGKVEVDSWEGVVNPLHFKRRAKRIIHLYMAGGPSHLETFDYKPKLGEMHGKPMPGSYTKGQPIAQLQGKKLNCLGPQHPFKRFGKSGQSICGIFPHIGSVADELCIVRSLRSKAINHDPAHTFMNTGTTISGRPSIGAWLLYGLGSETESRAGPADRRAPMA